MSGRPNVVKERRICGISCPKDDIERVKDTLADESLFAMWLVRNDTTTASSGTNLSTCRLGLLRPG